MWHDLFSNASPEAGRWVGETYSLQKLAGSEFEVKDDSSSPGIQVTDVVLWLYSQYRKGKQLPPKVSQILEYVLSHGWENDFSFVGVEKLCLQRFGPVFSQPLSAEKEKAAQELLVESEKKRRASIEQYEHDRVRPYMRQVPPAIPAD